MIRNRQRKKPADDIKKQYTLSRWSTIQNCKIYIHKYPTGQFGVTKDIRKAYTSVTIDKLLQVRHTKLDFEDWVITEIYIQLGEDLSY